MFLFSGRGYWQELIESIVWAHNKLKVAPAIQPRALSITQGRAVGVAHYLTRWYWNYLVVLFSKNYCSWLILLKDFFLYDKFFRTKLSFI